MIKALVGLGNEGAAYEKTYHNVGAFAAQQIALLAAQEDRTVLVYPVRGFMNASGIPVQRWLKQNNVQPAEYVVIHDDSDLTIGSYKLVRGGGSAGHKGIESVIAQLGTEDFWRLRIGVRDPNEQVRQKAADFVLQQWRSSDEESFVAVCRQALADILTH